MGNTTQNPTSPSAPAPAPTPAAPQGFSAADIQGLYTDQLKTYDVPRALKGVSPQGPGGTYSLSQLQALNPSWMSQRSRSDWQSALSGLSSLRPAGAAASGNATALGLNPQNPPPFSMTMPWANLATNDPGFQMMARNAGYGNTVTPMPQMTPMGWNPSGMPGTQPTGDPTNVTGGLPNAGPSMPWSGLASMLSAKGKSA
jgi:hypothetical protein